MNQAVSADRAEAVRLFEDFLDGLSADEVRQFIAGRRALAFLSVDGKVPDVRDKPLDEAFGMLDKFTATEAKTLVKGPKVPATKTDVMNFILGRTHGKTYIEAKTAHKAVADQIKAAQKAEADRLKAAKKAAAAAQRKPSVPKEKSSKAVVPSAADWTPAEIVAWLRRTDSAAEAEAMLSPRPVLVRTLTEVAGLLGLKLGSKAKKPDIIEEIVYKTITGPRTLERAQS